MATISSVLPYMSCIVTLTMFSPETKNSVMSKEFCPCSQVLLITCLPFTYTVIVPFPVGSFLFKDSQYMVIVQLTPSVMAEGMDVNFKSVSVVPPLDPPPPAPRL